MEEAIVETIMDLYPPELDVAEKLGNINKIIDLLVQAQGTLVKIDPKDIFVVEDLDSKSINNHEIIIGAKNAVDLRNEVIRAGSAGKTYQIWRIKHEYDVNQIRKGRIGYNVTSTTWFTFPQDYELQEIINQAKKECIGIVYT